MYSIIRTVQGQCEDSWTVTAHPLCFEAQAVLQRLCIGLSVLAVPRQAVHFPAQACCPLLQLLALLLQMELRLCDPLTPSSYSQPHIRVQCSHVSRVLAELHAASPKYCS